MGSSIWLIDFPSAYVGRSCTNLHSCRSSANVAGLFLAPDPAIRFHVQNRKHPQGADRPCADLAVCRLLCWMWVRRTDQHRDFSARLRLSSCCFLLDWAIYRIVLRFCFPPSSSNIRFRHNHLAIQFVFAGGYSPLIVIWILKYVTV